MGLCVLISLSRNAGGRISLESSRVSIVATMDENLVDDIIRRLLEANNGRTGKKQVPPLTEAEIRQLCSASKEVFLSQPNLLELEAPIKICGNQDTLFLLSMLIFFP